MSKLDSDEPGVQTESLTDLPLTAEEAEGTRAGTGTVGIFNSAGQRLAYNDDIAQG